MKMNAFWAVTVVLCAGLMSCQQSTTPQLAGADAAPVLHVAAPAATLTTVAFDALSHDFGAITAGEVVKHRYVFRNTGAAPVLIESVKPSCGCTSGDYSKEEIAPGGEGFVELSFNSQGKTGVQKKSATVTFSNTDPRVVVLSFAGEVVTKAE